MKKAHILIAEDDKDDRYLMKTALDEAGITQEVIFVENGVEAINHLQSAEESVLNFPILILLDLNMPKMDGREVLKRIKTNNDLRSIPVIVFSTTNDKEEVRRCYKLGANTYVVKPMSYDALVETLRHIRDYWIGTATLIIN